MMRRGRGAFLFLVCAGIYASPLLASAAVPIWAKVFTSYLGSDGVYYPTEPTAHTDGGGVGATSGWGNHDLPSYADIYMANNPRHYIVGAGNLEGLGTTGSKGWVYDKSTYQSTWTSVTPGTPLTLEWACMPTQQLVVKYTKCVGGPNQGSCNNTYTWYVTTNYTDYPSATVNDKVEGDSIGSINLSATNATTAYTVSCNPHSKTGLGWTSGRFTDPMPDIALQVVVDACPGAAPAAPGNADGLILKPGATAKVTAANGREYCFNNATGSSYFIPDGSSAELTLFIKAAMAGNLVDSKGNAVTYFPPSY